MKTAKKLDPAELLERIASLLHQEGNVQHALAALVKLCEARGASLDSSAIRRLPVEEELERLERWFATLWTPKAPPKACDGPRSSSEDAQIERIEPPKKHGSAAVVGLPKGELFRMETFRDASSWLLAAPTSGEQKVDLFFAREGKRIKSLGPYSVPVYTSGRPLDFSFSTAGVPIVRREVAERSRKPAEIGTEDPRRHRTYR